MHLQDATCSRGVAHMMKYQEWLRVWCLDSKCKLDDYEDSMRLNILES